MTFLLNLINPLLKYKWLIIFGLWLTSLLYVSHLKTRQCKSEHLKDVVKVTAIQSKQSDVADVKLHKDQSSSKTKSETGIKNVIEYKEKIKTVNGTCPIDPIVGDDYIRVFDNTDNDTAKNPG